MMTYDKTVSKRILIYYRQLEQVLLVEHAVLRAIAYTAAYQNPSISELYLNERLSMKDYSFLLRKKRI